MDTLEIERGGPAIGSCFLVSGKSNAKESELRAFIERWSALLLQYHLTQKTPLSYYLLVDENVEGEKLESNFFMTLTLPMRMSKIFIYNLGVKIDLKVKVSIIW